jgi:hypothetical protein
LIGGLACSLAAVGRLADILPVVDAHAAVHGGNEQLAVVTEEELAGETEPVKTPGWHSNYPMVMGRLRFNWEQIYRANHADTYALRNPAAADLPGKSLDDKHEWLMRQEAENRLRWPEVFQPALASIFSGWSSEEVRDVFKPLWDRLSGFVHPSSPSSFPSMRCRNREAVPVLGLLPVLAELARRGWCTKQTRTKEGHVHGGRPFTRSSLYRLLTNVTYMGQVRYRNEIHPGEQPLFRAFLRSPLAR